jgi:hypothetical protein
VRLPERRFAVALLRRAFFLWIGVRLLVAVAGGGGVGSRGLLPLAFRAAGLVVLAVSFLALLEARRRNEQVLLANFGVSQGTLVGISVLPAALAEAAVWLMSSS